MKFAIITHASHKRKENTMFSYEPYVREMNLWTPHATEVQIIAPIGEGEITSIETSYDHKNIQLIPIAAFDVLSIKNTLKTLRLLPKTAYNIYKTMLWADHIHLRCPGNIGLIGCFVQLLFPNKPKTAKYAGNWDPKAKQPWSYRLQKWILSNTFLTKNMKVLVYGEWPNQSKNIVPFFTASYSEIEKEGMTVKEFYKSFSNSTTLNQTNNDLIKLLFVGSLASGKQPLLSVQVVQQLKLKGYYVKLDIYGEGIERATIENYLKKHGLENVIVLHGNVNKETIKKAYQQAHFLLFISKSEGWPKVVAEAMFWACLPITSNVSCIPFMLDNGKRGAIVNSDIKEISGVIEEYLKDEQIYKDQVKKAMEWSRIFTLEKFEEEIKKFLI
jgi:glycosyltransferase involved in cell wall biosynthesis